MDCHVSFPKNALVDQGDRSPLSSADFSFARAAGRKVSRPPVSMPISMPATITSVSGTSTFQKRTTRETGVAFCTEKTVTAAISMTINPIFFMPHALLMC